ncbi:MAG: hypothetical protein K2W95_19215 [Candidatus Obscuribacterales bacterium]|nr:hypothetical protein [Candidatus Obscuribacterales bacterium]
MSYAWAFYSMPMEAFNKVIGGGDEELQKRAIYHITRDLKQLAQEDGDMTTLNGLARTAISKGIRYNNLNEDHASLLDQVILSMLSCEGLEKELKLEPESPDYLNPEIVEELVASSSSKEGLLRYLVAGRRFGVAEPFDCEYCIFEPHEVEELRREVDRVMTASKSWSADNVPKVVRECLQDVLRTTVQKGRALVGRLG